MAVILKMELKLDETSADLENKLKLSSGSKEKVLAGFNNLWSGIAGGIYPASVDAELGAVKASGTVTCASVQAADEVTIDGVVLTAVSGTPAADEFDISGSDTADAASLVAAIAANATLAARVSASSALGVVTIQARDAGALGNSISLASSNGTRLAVSAAALASGANGTQYSFEFGRAAD